MTDAEMSIIAGGAILTAACGKVVAAAGMMMTGTTGVGAASARAREH